MAREWSGTAGPGHLQSSNLIVTSDSNLNDLASKFRDRTRASQRPPSSLSCPPAQLSGPFYPDAIDRCFCHDRYFMPIIATSLFCALWYHSGESLALNASATTSDGWQLFFNFSRVNFIMNLQPYHYNLFSKHNIGIFIYFYILSIFGFGLLAAKLFYHIKK